MSDITNFNMKAPAMIRTLEKGGVTVCDERNKSGGFDLVFGGRRVGELVARNGDGVPYIRSFCVEDVGCLTVFDTEKQRFTREKVKSPKRYYSAAGFLRYGIK